MTLAPVAGSTATTVRARFEVTGVVQGVGFRPHVHRLARRHHLTGWVSNTDHGVSLEVQGQPAAIERFTHELAADAPPLASISTWAKTQRPAQPGTTFEIRASETGRAPTLAVPPDVAACAACLDELHDPTNRRYRHPFISCTDCGPRTTIVTGLPFDRSRTSMADFELCGACRAEYRDVDSRRHHAQTIACPDCGPTVSFHRSGPTTTRRRTLHAAIDAARRALGCGEIVAVKGIGGFHLVADATSDATLARLRERKGRPDKPLAVMIPDLATARLLASLTPAAEVALTSPTRPVVIVPARPGTELSGRIAPGLDTIGLLLPSSPLQHLLFEPGSATDRSLPALVCTSGNRSGQPMVIDDAAARRLLGPIADAMCSHDRTIHIACDDSVVQPVGNDVVVHRRGKGLAPQPVHLPFPVPAVLALGGDLKNTFCLASGRDALLSQPIGDLADERAQQAWRDGGRAAAERHGIEPTAIAIDAHPGYHSARLGRLLGRNLNCPVLTVQHHHAHLAALLVEHEVDASTPVIGAVFDGTGYGTDGTLWGGEFLVGGYAAAPRRAGLAAVPLPGGTAAIRAPWRMALSHLLAAGVDTAGLPAPGQASAVERDIVLQQAARGMHSPPTSSMGRLFDAVASLLDVCHEITYEAQAAIELEALARTATATAPPLRFEHHRDGVVGAGELVRGLVDGLRSGADPAGLALAFHQAVAAMVASTACRLRTEAPQLTSVGLSGGVFQNALLSELTVEALTAERFRVLRHRDIPANDGGIALGQAAVAGYRLQHGADRQTERSST
ncbi:MAG: carbamoyltransferase HypF [Acidimicrobiales bacterium]|nr:carbamoyltransferase HypF [Acidimicrobiales bacterium]